MKKLTDAEVVKALEHCNSLKCLGCPCIQEQASCLDVLTTNVLEFIERKDDYIKSLQKTNKEMFNRANELYKEIEHLDNELVSADEVIGFREAEIERLKEAYSIYEETTGLKQAKSEAYKEFAEKVKDATFHYYDSDIDNVYKELTEGNNG